VEAQEPIEAGALNDGPKRIVADGYDAIADSYYEWASSFHTPAMRWLDELLDRLDDGSDVLDLGCGRGVPFTQKLARRHRVTGVDISPRQIGLARALVPEATFVAADATSLEQAPESLDAVVSLFMLGHVPPNEQGPLLKRIAGWLRSGGFLLATMATSGTEAVDPDWLGAPMYFASHRPEENRALLHAAGLEILRDRVMPHHEPGHGDVSFMWLLARKPEA
jgi:cyclopropane fatty-acyl-phospholipid synthase-like methyltransferase